MSASQNSSSPFKQPLSDVPKGTRRIKHTITAGLVISNDEARKWYKKRTGDELPENHRADFNIPVRLDDILLEGELAELCYECDFAPRLRGAKQTGPNITDFLVVTQYVEGEWEHDGPDGYEEVLVDVKEARPGDREERVKELLKEHGIETCGFKKYFEDEDDVNDDFEDEDLED